MSTSNSATEPLVIRATIYLPEPILIQLFQWLAHVTTPAPRAAARDEKADRIADVPAPPVPQIPPTFSPPTEPAMDAVPTTTPGDADLEEDDGEGDAIAPIPAGEAPPGTPPSATSLAPGGPPPLPPRPARPRLSVPR
jgi:hypothetical protein